MCSYNLSFILVSRSHILSWIFGRGSFRELCPCFGTDYSLGIWVASVKRVPFKLSRHLYSFCPESMSRLLPFDFKRIPMKRFGFTNFGFICRFPSSSVRCLCDWTWLQQLCWFRTPVSYRYSFMPTLPSRLPLLNETLKSKLTSALGQ